MGGIYSPHTPQKGSRHIARHDECRNFDDFGSRDMAGAFSGGSGGIDTPRAPVTKVSVTSSPINLNLKNYPPTTTYPRPKKNGPRKERPREERSLPSANTGRAPSGMGGPCSHSPHWAQKNLFQKGFCGAFSLKKRPPAPAGAPKPLYIHLKLWYNRPHQGRCFYVNDKRQAVL